MVKPELRLVHTPDAYDQRGLLKNEYLPNVAHPPAYHDLTPHGIQGRMLVVQTGSATIEYTGV
jgi:hypothetical protein